jgi:hypothetical protein
MYLKVPVYWHWMALDLFSADAIQIKFLVQVKTTPGIEGQGFVNQQELAAWFGVGRRFIASLARKRIIPEVWIGKIRLYDPQKVKAALEKFESKTIV